MNTITRLITGLLLLLSTWGAEAQYTTQGPTNMPALNSTVFVGSAPGFIANIQAAVTFACSAGVGRSISIPAGYTGTDLITSVTGGCTRAFIWDDRAVSRACYSWTGSAYASTACGSGGGVTPSGSSQVVVGTGSGYMIRQLTPGDIAPAFTASFGCSVCGVYETGYPGISSAGGSISYTNPTVPTSASVSDGTNTVSLTTPFTSWTLSHSYTSNTTFTLTALGNGQTITPTAQILFEPRSFGGVGAAGATSTVTASGTTAVLSNGAVLASAGLSNSNVGQTFGPYSPSGQKVYLLILGGTHTFKDATTGFAFAFNTPTAVTFSNANGVAVTMYLYESTSLLTGTFSVLVVS